MRVSQDWDTRSMSARKAGGWWWWGVSLKSKEETLRKLSGHYTGARQFVHSFIQLTFVTEPIQLFHIHGGRAAVLVHLVLKVLDDPREVLCGGYGAHGESFRHRDREETAAGANFEDRARFKGEEVVGRGGLLQALAMAKELVRHQHRTVPDSSSYRIVILLDIDLNAIGRRHFQSRAVQPRVTQSVRRHLSNPRTRRATLFVLALGLVAALAVQEEVGVESRHEQVGVRRCSKEP